MVFEWYVLKVCTSVEITLYTHSEAYFTIEFLTSMYLCLWVIYMLNVCSHIIKLLHGNIFHRLTIIELVNDKSLLHCRDNYVIGCFDRPKKKTHKSFCIYEMQFKILIFWILELFRHCCIFCFLFFNLLMAPCQNEDEWTEEEKIFEKKFNNSVDKKNEERKKT